MKAFEVFKDDVLAGYLGEGPGPLLSRIRSHGPSKSFEFARFSSVNGALEGPVAECLSASSAFEPLLAALKKRGFRLEPVAFEGVFPERGE